MTMIRRLRCELTDKELKSKGSALALKVTEYRAKKLAAKNAASSVRSELKEIDAEIQTLTRDVQDGSEERPVEVVEVHDVRRGQVSFERKDTGEEINCRAMTSEEREAASASENKGGGKRQTKVQTGKKEEAN
jgi:hypothetical protein